MVGGLLSAMAKVRNKKEGDRCRLHERIHYLSDIVCIPIVSRRKNTRKQGYKFMDERLTTHAKNSVIINLNKLLLKHLKLLIIIIYIQKSVLN